MSKLPKYWIVRVEQRFENDKGKVQKTNEQYLVSAVSPTDAEAKIYEKLNGMGSDFSVKAVVASKIIEVFE